MTAQIFNTTNITSARIYDVKPGVGLDTIATVIQNHEKLGWKLQQILTEMRVVETQDFDFNSGKNKVVPITVCFPLMFKYASENEK